MTTINAQSIINEVMRAQAMAPSRDDASPLLEFKWIMQKAWGLFNNAECNEQAHYLEEQETEHARGEWLELNPAPPATITFKTSARGSHRIANTKENLARFADMVRKNAGAFGGGLVRISKPRAAVSWPAKLVTMFKQSIEDKDYQAAFDLGEQLGALFAIGTKGNALMQVAPVPCEFDARFVSAMNETGFYTITEPISMMSANGYQPKKWRNRAGLVQQVAVDFAGMTADMIDSKINKAILTPANQDLARAQWMAEHGLSDDQAIQARIDAQAADDVAQVVASARAMAAIEQASESSALQALASDTSEASDTSTEQAASQANDAPELATVCEQAQQASQQAPGAPGGSMGHAGTVNTSSVRQVASSARAQAITSKSGAWNASFFAGDDGRPCLIFNGGQVLGFESGSERMRALQTMARQADAAAATGARWWHTATPEQRQAMLLAGGFSADGARLTKNSNLSSYGPMARAELLQAIEQGLMTSQAPDQSTPVLKSETPQDQAGPVLNSENPQDQAQALKDADPENLTFEQLRSIGFALMSDVDADSLSMATIQRWTPAMFAGAIEYLDDINHHSEALFLECMRAGRDDLAAVIAHLVRYQRAPEYRGLTGDYCEARQVVQWAMQGQAIEQVSPAAAWLLACWGFDLGAVLKSETPQDQSPAPGGLQITITRAEGNTETDTFEPVTVASFAAADALLHAWSETAPSRGGYNKCDFSIVWPNGDTYRGRYDLKHHSKEPASLTRHMVDNGEFHTGKFCPLHMSQADYDSFLKHHVTEEAREVYAMVLQTMAGLGAYFEKVRPVAIDLRAIIESGTQAGELVGLGVVYTGDRCNPSAEGAIVGVDFSQHYLDGVALLVTTEDGAQHRATLRDFDGKGAHSYRLTMKRHGAPYLAQLAATVATIKAQASAAKEQAAQANARALVDLMAQYPQLQRSASTHAGGKLAAVNMRTLLKLAFPGHKFSVTSSYNSARICWTDGPTDDEVSAIIGRFDIGASDTQSDYFYTVRTAWSDLFGGVQYLNTSRNTSDDLVSRALCELYPDSATRPTVQDYQNGAGVFDWRHGGDNVRRMMREQLAKMSSYQAPAPKARARA